MTRWCSKIAGALVAIAALVATRYVAGEALHRGFPVDDAWIHMVYGLALRNEGSFTYNDGVLATGCTSPLWAFLISIVHLAAGARGPSEKAALFNKLLGFALHAGSAVVAARVVANGTRRAMRPLAIVVTGLLVAASPVGAFAAVSGMEVSLTALLILAAFLATSWRRSWLAGAFAGIAILARPEAVLVLPAITFANAFARPTNRRAPSLRERLGSVFRTIGIAIVPPALLAIRNVLASGRPLPATYYQKARGLHLDRVDVELRLVFDFMLEALPPYGSAILLALASAAIVLGVVALARLRLRTTSRRFRGAILGAGASATAFGWLAAMALTVPGITPKAFYYQRYFAPVLPLLVVAGVLALSEFASLRQLRAPQWARRVAFALIGILLFARELSGLDAERYRYASDVESIDSTQVGLGKFVARTTPPDAVIYSQDAGASRYFGRRLIVDLCRLNTPELLASPQLPESLAPTLVLVAPTIFTVGPSDGIETVAAFAPPVTNDRHARQVAMRCNGNAPRLTVSFRGALIADAPCRQSPPRDDAGSP